MSNLKHEIQKHIRKLTFPLKEEKELREVLKARLTKKEYKLLLEWAKETPKSSVTASLNLDDERYKDLSAKIIKKLNQEKLKQEMTAGI